MNYAVWDGFFEVCGFLGVALYLGAYAGLQFGLLRGSRYPYTVMNLLAAVLVLISLIASFNLWSAIIQISWIIISIVGLTRTYLLWRKTRFNNEEKELLTRKFPELSAMNARRFLDTGVWRDVGAGHVLATEGKVIGKLYYLATGTANASINGHSIGNCANGEFVGEVTCFTGAPASATLTTVSPARIFEADAEKLRALAAAEAELGLCMQQCLMRDTSAKLVAANANISLLREAAAV
ncbi:cyclic nucleotide-binding domain-containing protein [Defluviimonas aestuarii]|uniref:CBU_0592 family membrane protein n=1 Tax=Albidovulum aestuarii TaxID=1130726 RepID=UPI00249CADDF|nr:cyclic nucleotide-binding domain-containing protein [Defluviimonas aestuarii]MDI3337209.1 cyclic nucleotide-binding domain-containing protein [Defluviimonas aestuarii]